MILVIMEMTALPAKRKEFLQTVHALLQPIRKEKGCITCSACQDIEDENTFRLIEGWQTRQDLDRHLRSDQFTVLLGTKNFLSKAWETKFNVDRNYRRHPYSLNGGSLLPFPGRINAGG